MAKTRQRNGPATTQRRAGFIPDSSVHPTRFSLAEALTCPMKLCRQLHPVDDVWPAGPCLGCRASRRASPGEAPRVRHGTSPTLCLQQSPKGMAVSHALRCTACRFDLSWFDVTPFPALASLVKSLRSELPQWVPPNVCAIRCREVCAPCEGLHRDSLLGLLKIWVPSACSSFTPAAAQR